MTDLTLFSQDKVSHASSVFGPSTAPTSAAADPAAADPAAPTAVAPRAPAPTAVDPFAAGPASNAPAGPALPGFPSAGSEDLAGRVLHALGVLVDGLRALSGARVEERLRLVGRCESRLAAVKSEAVAELAAWRGEAQAADVLCGDLKQSRGAAKREVKLAGQLADVPATAEALADGAITPQHARLIAEAAEAAPPGAPIDEAELLEAAANQAADLFGRTVRGHLDERAGDEQTGERRITVEFDAEPRLMIAWRAVSGLHEDAPALQMLGSLLTAGRSTRLYRRLVAEDQSAIHVSAHLGPGFSHPGLFIVNAVPKAPHTTHELELSIYQELDDIRASEPEPNALDRIKNQIRAGEFRRLSSNLELGMQIAESEAVFGDWRETFRLSRRILEVTPEDVRRVAVKYLDTGRRTVATMVPKGDSK